MIFDWIIIDFDSTICSKESLDFLAQRSIEQDDMEKKIDQIKNITIRGMNGELDFQESIRRRLDLLKLDKKVIDQVKEELKNHISKSFIDHRQFIKDHADKIFVISGGFRELILDSTRVLNIPDSHVFANHLVMNDQDEIIGFDERNILSRNGGKPEMIQELGLKGKIAVIGDGYTDYEIKERYPEVMFYLYIEHQRREALELKADGVISNFVQFIATLE